MVWGKKKENCQIQPDTKSRALDRMALTIISVLRAPHLGSSSMSPENIEIGGPSRASPRLPKTLVEAAGEVILVK